ncbi:hypothetical protein SPLC1_S102810 [Arthrospira platensis C1]|nr:hypothetical protein SPLC1_S102810 [Arthrospira platensis C1]
MGATQQRSRLGEVVGWVQPNKGVGWVKRSRAQQSPSV